MWRGVILGLLGSIFIALTVISAHLRDIKHELKFANCTLMAQYGILCDAAKRTGGNPHG